MGRLNTIKIAVPISVDKLQRTVRKRLLTGDRPTGRLHLGHYVGSLANRVEMQELYETFILIADVQAMTDHFEHPEILQQNLKEIVLDYLSVGIDPEKSTICVQSLIPQIAELSIYYLNLVSVARLERNPTIKDELQQKGMAQTVSAGFLTYPVHQAADITIFNADVVPVGSDQLPMIEQTVEIVRRFNTLYGPVFVEPQAKVGSFPRLVGTDGQAKMSKSLGNAIDMADDERTVEAKVMKMYTDPTRIRPTDPGHVEGNPVFIYHEIFNRDREEVEDLKTRYRAGRVGDVEVKKRLVSALNIFLDPIRISRARFAATKDLLDDILREGTHRACLIAEETLTRVRDAMKMDYTFMHRS